MKGTRDVCATQAVSELVVWATVAAVLLCISGEGRLSSLERHNPAACAPSVLLPPPLLLLLLLFAAAAAAVWLALPARETLDRVNRRRRARLRAIPSTQRQPSASAFSPTTAAYRPTHFVSAVNNSTCPRPDEQSVDAVGRPPTRSSSCRP